MSQSMFETQSALSQSQSQSQSEQPSQGIWSGVKSMISQVFGFKTLSELQPHQLPEAMETTVAKIKASPIVQTCPEAISQIEIKNDMFTQLLLSAQKDAPVDETKLAQFASLILPTCMEVEGLKVETKVQMALITKTNERINETNRQVNQVAQELRTDINSLTMGANQVVAQVQKLQERQDEIVKKIETRPALSDAQVGELVGALKSGLGCKAKPSDALDTTSLNKVLRNHLILQMAFTTDEVNGLNHSVVVLDEEADLTEEDKADKSAWDSYLVDIRNLFQEKLGMDISQHININSGAADVVPNGWFVINYKVLTSYIARRLTNYLELLGMEDSGEKLSGTYTTLCSRVGTLLTQLGAVPMTSMGTSNDLKHYWAGKISGCLEAMTIRSVKNIKTIFKNKSGEFVMFPLWRAVSIYTVIKAIQLVKTQEDFDTLVKDMNSKLQSADQIKYQRAAWRSDLTFNFGLPSETLATYNIYPKTNDVQYLDRPDQSGYLNYGLFWVGHMSSDVMHHKDPKTGLLSGKRYVGVTDQKYAQMTSNSVLRMGRDAKLKYIYGWTDEQIEAGHLVGIVDDLINVPVSKDICEIPTLKELRQVMKDVDSDLSRIREANKTKKTKEAAAARRAAKRPRRAEPEPEESDSSSESESESEAEAEAEAEPQAEQEAEQEESTVPIDLVAELEAEPEAEQVSDLRVCEAEPEVTLPKKRKLPAYMTKPKFTFNIDSTDDMEDSEQVSDLRVCVADAVSEPQPRKTLKGKGRPQGSSKRAVKFN